MIFKPKEKAFAWRKLKQVHRELPLIGDGFKERLDITNVRRTKRLAGYDLKNKKVVYNRVVELETQLAKGTWYLLNKQVLVFQEQSILANGRCVHVRDLKVGDKLIGRLGREVELTDIQKFKGTHTFYKMQISGDHSYFANGILLHNAGRFRVGTATATWTNSDTSIWSGTTGGASGASVPGSADTATFDANSGAGITTTNYNVTVSAFAFSSSSLFAGTLSLGGTITSTGTFTFGSGTFLSNGFTCTFNVMSGSNANTRTLNITNSTVILTGTGATIWTLATTTGLTFVSTGSTINCTDATSGNRSFGMATNTYNNFKVSAGAGTVTFSNSTPSFTGNIDFTGFSGTWTSAINYSIQGNLTLGAGMTITDSTANASFTGSGTQTITSNGVTGMRSMTVNSTGTVTLADDLALNSARTLTVTAGTFTANNKNVTTGLFSSSNSSTRSIIMGSGTWTITGTGTVWTTGTQTGLTLDPGTSTIDVTDTSATTKTFAGGNGGTLNNVIFRGGAIAWNNTPTTYNDVTFYANNTVVTVSAPTTKIFRGNLILYTSPGNLVTFVSSSPGTPYTFSKASNVVAADYISLTDSIATGGAVWYAGSHSINVSNNTGWIFADPPAVPTATPQKTYIYKISRQGSYLGVIPPNWVVSEFGYSHDINSPAAQMSIEVSATPDIQQLAPDYITTEGGDKLITEGGDRLTTERAPDVVGNLNSKALIRNNNDIEVYEFSSYYPNGKLVFSGFISKWKAKFGTTDTIEMTVLSHGAELDNYIIQGSTSVDISQTSQDDRVLLFDDTGDKFAGWSKAGQTFTVGALIDNVAAILVRLAAASSTPVTVEVKLWNSSDEYFTGTPLATASQTITSTSPADYTFTFPTPATVLPGQQYFFSVQCITFNGAYVYRKNTDVYSGGAAKESAYGGGSGGGSWAPSGGGIYDLYFITYFTGGEISSPFLSQDPTTMLRSIIDSYVSAGGTVDYASGTTQLTGLTRSYTFKLNTVLEGIKKILDISPSDWYWYVDPATNIIYFKETSTTADFTMTYGRNIQSLEIEATVENLKNKVYFSGGDVGGGQNLFLTETDNDSITANAGRIGLARLTDNRVTLTDTGTAVMDSFLDGNSAEAYTTTLVINDKDYDTKLFSPGKVIGFAGYGSFVDGLLLQVVRIQPKPDYITLVLGILPKRTTVYIEELARRIAAVETVDNPDAPS